MNVLKKIFAPKEVKATLGILDELSLSFGFRAFAEIKSVMEHELLSTSGQFVELVRRGTAPRELGFTQIANLAGNLVESGHYHVWRGVLTPLDDGPNLLRLFDAALDELVRIGALDTHKASEQKRIVRKNIADVG